MKSFSFNGPRKLRSVIRVGVWRSGLVAASTLAGLFSLTVCAQQADQVTPVVVQRLDLPSTGAGEEVMGATAAAIANAFFDATGARLRQYPMTPERVRAALAART